MTSRYKVRYGLPADARLAAAAKRAGLPRGVALAVWITLLDYAGRHRPHGTIQGLTAEDVAALLDFSTDKIETLLQAFRDRKMLTKEDALKDWGEVSPVTIRTRRHRARKRREMRDAAWRAPLPADDPDDPATVARRRARLQEERRTSTEKRRPSNTKPLPPGEIDMMTVIDDKRPKDQASDPLKDPWADWKPMWTRGRKQQTPHDLQEKHSPTEVAAVKLTAERRVQKSQRRIVDARLWDSMSPAQQDAALEIAAAHDMMGRGLGYVMSNWERIPGCRGAEHVADMHARLINTYVDWTRCCAKAKVSHSMIIDILSFGFTCRMLDRDRRLRTGHSRQNLMEGLSLYCELRGWPSQ